MVKLHKATGRQLHSHLHQWHHQTNGRIQETTTRRTIYRRPPVLIMSPSTQDECLYEGLPPDKLLKDHAYWAFRVDRSHESPTSITGHRPPRPHSSTPVRPESHTDVKVPTVTTMPPSTQECEPLDVVSTTARSYILHHDTSQHSTETPQQNSKYWPPSKQWEHPKTHQYARSNMDGRQNHLQTKYALWSHPNMAIKVTKIDQCIDSANEGDTNCSHIIIYIATLPREQIICTALDYLQCDIIKI